MAKKKDPRSKTKKAKKAKVLKVEIGGTSRSFNLSPEIGERLAAAGAELQSRAEAVFAQWLDQASLTLRKSGVQTLVDDVKAAGKQMRMAEARGGFEKVAKSLASTVANEITKFAMSATIAKAGTGKAAKTPAAKAAPAKPKPAAAKATAAKTVATKPAVKAKPGPRKVAAAKPAAKPAAKAASKPAQPTKAAPKAAGKAPATAKNVAAKAPAAAKPAAKPPAVKSAAAKSVAAKGKSGAAKPAAARRSMPRPTSRPAPK